MTKFQPRQNGKSLYGVISAKAAQAQGKRVLYVTLNQTGTAAMLAKHGALSEVIGEHYLRPVFRKDKTDE